MFIYSRPHSCSKKFFSLQAPFFEIVDITVYNIHGIRSVVKGDYTFYYARSLVDNLGRAKKVLPCMGILGTIISKMGESDSDCIHLIILFYGFRPRNEFFHHR